MLYLKISLLKVIKEFQEYVEPEEGYQGSPQRRGPSSGQEDEHVSLPLGENVLTHNLGIPVLVVCTKVSCCSGEKFSCFKINQWSRDLFQ